MSPLRRCLLSRSVIKLEKFSVNRSADVSAFVCDQALDFERSEVSTEFPNISTHVYLLVLLSIFGTVVKITAYLLVRVSNISFGIPRLQCMEWSHVKGKISMQTGDLKVKFYQGIISSMDNAFFRK